MKIGHRRPSKYAFAPSPVRPRLSVSNARGRGRFRGIHVDPAHVALPGGGRPRSRETPRKRRSMSSSATSVAAGHRARFAPGPSRTPSVSVTWSCPAVPHRACGSICAVPAGGRGRISGLDRHRGGGHPPTPATPPCVRVRHARCPQRDSATFRSVCCGLHGLARCLAGGCCGHSRLSRSANPPAGPGNVSRRGVQQLHGIDPRRPCEGGRHRCRRVRRRQRGPALRRTDQVQLDADADLLREQRARSLAAERPQFTAITV
jgi:hypothetical protein